MFARTLTRMYSWGLPGRIWAVFEAGNYSVLEYLRWVFTSKDLSVPKGVRPKNMMPVWVLQSSMLIWLVFGLTFFVRWQQDNRDGYWAFGGGILVAYPVVLLLGFALVVGVAQLIRYVFQPKKMGKSVVCYLLELQIKRLRKKNSFKLVAVGGSVGKTSTKLAIAQLLGQTKRVRYQQGNYNDRLTVPLIFFDQPAPSLFNIVSWVRLMAENMVTLEQPYPYDVVVVELGTDGPGQMRHFAYLKPDIAVLTGVTPEHMEYFGSIENVAKEESAILSYSKTSLINADTVDNKLVDVGAHQLYSLRDKKADYFATSTRANLHGQHLSIKMPGKSLKSTVTYIGNQGASFALAAAAVADKMDVSAKDIASGLENLEHFSGRMQLLPGIKGSTLIDDTYNATPIAVKAALDVLYKANTPQRIAILGSMNELGPYSQAAHQEVGEHCNPNYLDMVVTIGDDARRWLAPIARSKGCQVHTFKSPHDAGIFVRKQLKHDAVVLGKGSQNGVFAEEALKQLLAHPGDADKLVRQSREWLRRKSF